MAAAAAPIAIASSVASGGLSIAQGFSQRSSLRAKAKAAEIDAKYATLRSVQVAGQRQEQMNDVISAVNSIRVGRGVGLDSATGRAIRADARKRGGEVKRQSVLNEILSRDRSKAAAAGYRSSAAAAPWIGLVKAIPSFADAYGTAFPGKE
jgi:hypothetical protein